MNKKFLYVIIAILCIMIDFSNISYAYDNEKAVSYDKYGLSTYEGMINTLKNIEKRSKHTNLSVIGQSVGGKDIYLVTFGKYEPKNPTILILSQQHGNEGLPAQSALNFIKKVSLNNNTELIDKVNILVVPRLNVDGAEGKNGIPTRANLNEVDLNRDHLSKSQPETQALHLNVLRKYKIDYMVDFHQRASDSTAMLYPTNQAVKPEVLKKSKQLGAIVYKTFRGNNWNEISEYHGGSVNTMARNEIACEYGIATLLFEMGGMIDFNDSSYVINKKENNKRIREGEISMFNLVNSIANKEIDNMDINIWNTLCQKINPFK